MKNALLASVVVFLAGCTEVQILATNETTLSQPLTLEDKDSSGIVQRSYELGTITPNTKNMLVFSQEIRRGHSIAVRTSAGLEEKRSVTSSPNPLIVSVTLPSPPGRFIPDSVGVGGLAAAFTDTGAPTGFPPSDIRQALRSLIGSLVCYKPTSTTNPRATLVYAPIPPGRLSAAMSYESLIWSGFSFSNDVEVTESAATKANASIPVYGSIAGSNTRAGLRKYHIITRGNGHQAKPEESSFSLIGSVNSKLSDEEKQTLLNLMTDQDVACSYINSFWAIRQIDMSVENSTKITSTGLVTALTILTLEGAYNYQGSNSTLISMSDVMVNVGGPVFRFQRRQSPLTTPILLDIVTPGAAGDVSSTVRSNAPSDIGGFAGSIISPSP